MTPGAHVLLDSHLAEHPGASGRYPAATALGAGAAMTWGRGVKATCPASDERAAAGAKVGEGHPSFRGPVIRPALAKVLTLRESWTARACRPIVHP